MKKWMAIFLAVAMLLSFAACDSEKWTDSKEPEEKEFSIGEVNGRIYENEFLGMGYKLESGWRYYKKEEREELPARLKEICAMYAATSAGKVSVRLDFQKMSETQLESLNLTDYCGQYLLGRERDYSDWQYEIGTGYSDLSVKIGGKTINGRLLTINKQGSRLYEAAFAIKCDGYLARISVCAKKKEDIEDIMGGFFILGEKPDREEEIEQKQTEPVKTEPQDEQKQPELSLGQVTGYTYENKFIGIGCELNNAWRFATEEEILERNNLVGEVMGDQALEALKNAKVIFDMVADKKDRTGSITVNLTKASSLQLAKLDLETYYKSEISLMDSAFAQMGLANTSYEVKNTEVGGKEILCLWIKAEGNGIAMYEVVFAIKCDGYLANIAVGSVNEKELEEILSCFYFIPN